VTTSAQAGATRIPLTGADCFLRAFDAEIARWNDASHVSGLVLRLGPGFDVEVFRKLLEDIALAQPILSARVRRRFGVGTPAYDLPETGRRRSPEVVVHDIDRRRADDEPFPAIFEDRLNQRRSLRRGELLRFDVVRYAGGAGGTDLGMSWLHLLFDGAGSERFVQWLDEVHRGLFAPETLPDPDELSAVRPHRPMQERGDAARSWKAWVDGFAAGPPHSLSGPRRRMPQALAFDTLRFDPDETEKVVAHAGRRAGFMTPMLFYLAATIRAHHAVSLARGLDPGHYLVPLPVNLRPKGREGAMFRTHVSLIWFHVDPKIVGDLDALVAELKAQRLSAIKAGHIDNGAEAMEFVRYVPTRLYTRMARSTAAGELCSFFFAYTGGFLPSVEHFLGAEVENAFHVAPVPASPGSCVAMSIHRGHLNVTHAYQRGVWSEGERALLHDSLRRDLLDED